MIDEPVYEAEQLAANCLAVSPPAVTSQAAESVNASPYSLDVRGPLGIRAKGLDKIERVCMRDEGDGMPRRRGFSGCVEEAFDRADDHCTIC